MCLWQMEGLVFPLHVPVDFCSMLGWDIVHISLPVVMFTWWWTWLMDVLYEVLAPVTQRSVPLLEEHQRNQLKTVKVISNTGNSSASN